MKILLLADIHSNWPALAAIHESFDACLFVGDLVEYGTDPVPCIEWARENVTAGVRGNHDHAVAQRIPTRDGKGFKRLADATRPLHWDLLDGTNLHYLARLAVNKRVTLGGQTFHLVHATPRDPLNEYLTNNPSGWADRLDNNDADFVCVGHTHLPFHIELDDQQVINPGSVGQPRDGDPRASYAVIEDGKVELRRVEYDIDLTLNQMRKTGLEDWVLELTEAVLRTGGRIYDQLTSESTD